jgi:hypothetical protein
MTDIGPNRAVEASNLGCRVRQDMTLTVGATSRERGYLAPFATVLEGPGRRSGGNRSATAAQPLRKINGATGTPG